jgi:hypothetical protein
MGGNPTNSLRDGEKLGREAVEPGTVDGVSAAPSVQRPTSAQRRYLERGLDQPGGKLPLFDLNGQEIGHRTIRACIQHGWAEPWFPNPIKPDWVVCRVTDAGRDAIGA